MIDWNQDGKIDAIDYAITADMMDDDFGEKPIGCCCGTTVAMFLIAILLPVIVFVVR